MQAPELPADEAERLTALRSSAVLDTAPEERFDRFTRLAKRLFSVPVVLVSLVDEDRQWFKSRQGLEATETPREVSFCAHAILDEQPLVVPDAAADERFADNPLVIGEPFIRFYAGCPLRTSDGRALGTLCLIDREPRTFEGEQLELLRDLADMVEQEFTAYREATTDRLTGLSNRRGLEAISRHTLALCRRLDMRASLLYFDLDHFKPINDGFGHAEGDRALITFAQLLKDTFREADVVARLGGDEFAVMCGGADEEGLASPIGRLTEAAHRVCVEEERGYDLDFSVGCVSFEPTPDVSLGEVLERADAKMYADKRAKGKAR